MRLNVGILRSEELLSPISGQVLDLVHYFASAVISVSWIPLGVLVG